MTENHINTNTNSNSKPTPISLPMSLQLQFSTLISDSDHYHSSFSQLLATTAAITSPARASSALSLGVGPPDQIFTIPPGLSPATLLDSPLLFPGQGSFGMSHQQALAHVSALKQQQPHQYSTMQLVHPDGFLPGPYSSNIPSSSSKANPYFSAQAQPPQYCPSLLNVSQACKPKPGKTLPVASNSSSSCSTWGADKPADDGYNWRKYGQKQVKGSEFPRSYYKCTHPSCPVKKKVERSLDGHITEIIYKGQHNHRPPTATSSSTNNNSNNKRSKHMINLSDIIQNGISEKLLQRQKQEEVEEESAGQLGANNYSMDDVHVDGNHEVDDIGRNGDDDEYLADPKTRSSTLVTSTSSSVSEPKIIVQTNSEVDLLDDGYRWRKYGQKVVKGNSYPRSYYKCTHPGCNVRKHIERTEADPKAVLTTYEGKHSHHVPPPRGSSHNIASATFFSQHQNHHLNFPGNGKAAVS